MKSDIFIQAQKEKILTCLEASRFEEAIKINKAYPNNICDTDIDKIISKLIYTQNITCRNGDKENLSLSLQIKALTKFRVFGSQPEKIIQTLDFNEGYCGKILMVQISGGVFDNFVCLRSGDLWHREILKNTQNEFKQLGFLSSSVYEMGGAHITFHESLSLTIWGTSEDFGSCDKYLTSRLIGRKFPNYKIYLED